MPSVTVNAAIYNDGGVYKHWGLFVEGDTEDDKIIFNVMGSSQRFRLEERKSDARNSDSIVEVLKLYSVHRSKIGAIRAAAQKTPVLNQYAGWNCQDYVLELLDTLEEDGVIDGNDKEYKKQKNKLRAKQEGLA